MRDPKEILDTIRCHLENGNMPAARRAILELQDTLHSLRMTADETRATLVAAIKLGPVNTNRKNCDKLPVWKSPRRSTVGSKVVSLESGAM